MGYWSDVAIVVMNEDFISLVHSAKEKCQSAYDLLSGAMIRQNVKYTTLFFENERWNEDYDEIQFIEDFIRELPHFFVRIGCNYDDIVVCCNIGENLDMLSCVSLVRRVYTDTAGDCIDFADIA